MPKAGPRYQKNAVYVQPAGKPRFDEAFCVWWRVRQRCLWTSAFDSKLTSGNVRATLRLVFVFRPLSASALPPGGIM